MVANNSLVDQLKRSRDDNPAELGLRSANIASVTSLSPFRYPGGKTWLVPYVRRWLSARQQEVKEFVEPFAGGASVGLSVAFDRLADHVTLVERDEAIAAVWQTILSDQGDEFAERVADFDLSSADLQAVLNGDGDTVEGLAFRTLVRNRVSRAGIMAAKAGRLNQGETLVSKAGKTHKGLLSRWYPLTLKNRIMAIWRMRDRITFIAGDGLHTLAQWTGRRDAAFFVDPPYSFAGAKAGTRLYNYSALDHKQLFRLVSRLSGDVLMTYNEAAEVKDLVGTYDLQTRLIPMRTAHHRAVNELLVGRDLSWLDDSASHDGEE